MSWLIGIHFGSGRSAIRRWLLGGREKAAAPETQSWGFLRSLGELLSAGSVSHLLASGCPCDPLYHQCCDSLVRTLFWIFLRERIHEWVENDRSPFKTCKRVLVLLLFVGAGGCSCVPLWQISMAWLGLGQEMMWSLGVMAHYVSTQINLWQWQSNFCFQCCITEEHELPVLLGVLCRGIF